MKSLKFPKKFIGLILAITFISGCNSHKATAPLTPTSVAPLQFVKTVQVTPDGTALTGGFIRLGYLNAYDRIVAVFGTSNLSEAGNDGQSGGHIYKYYDLNLEPDGRESVLNYKMGDSAELFVGNILYDVSMASVDNAEGWDITKYDAVTWEKLDEIQYSVNPEMNTNDMSIELVNGLLDVSSLYGRPGETTATHHNFFTTDLQFVDQRILSDTENTNGSSTLFINDTTYFITGTGFPGRIIMAKYDKEWNYLGMKTILQNGTWSEGSAFDGQYFYVAYMYASQLVGQDYLFDIHLAVFDRDWNLINDTAVTHYTVADSVQAWRPWILSLGNRLYVAYDAYQIDIANHTEKLNTMQAYISLYTLTYE